MQDGLEKHGFNIFTNIFNVRIMILLYWSDMHMITELTLKALCDKYGISSEKIVNKNNNVLNSGEYTSIDRILNYLVNELKYNARNIEK